MMKNTQRERTEILIDNNFLMCSIYFYSQSQFTVFYKAHCLTFQSSLVLLLRHCFQTVSSNCLYCIQC